MADSPSKTDSTPPKPFPEWNYADVRGPKADVLAAIDAGNAPETVKAFLRSLVEQAPYAGVKLHAHGLVHNDRFDGFQSITKLY